MEDIADTNPFAQVPIEVTISVGRARPLVRDLLRLSKDAVLQLDRRVDDPVELYVGDRLIARGELTELEGDNAGPAGGAPDRGCQSAGRVVRLAVGLAVAPDAAGWPGAGAGDVDRLWRRRVAVACARCSFCC